MIYEGITYNEIFIDPSAAEAGDGTSASSPLNALPYPLVSNTAYIIRRTSEDYSVLVNQQEDDTLTNVAFIGMPKSTDPQWIKNLVSDTTWLNDIADYANVRFYMFHYQQSGGNFRAILNSKNLHFLGINCDFYKDKFVANPGSSYRTHMNVMFSNNNPSNMASDNSSFKFYYCKFGNPKFKLEDDNWLANHNRNDYDDASHYDWLSLNQTGYLCGRYIHEISFDNCIINDIVCNSTTNFSGQSYSNDGGFNIYQCTDFSITNSIVNGMCFASTGNSGFDTTFLLDTFININVDNVVYNLILDYPRFHSFMYLYYGNSSGVLNRDCTFNFTNVTCNLKTMKGITGFDNVYYQQYLSVLLRSSGAENVNGDTVIFTDNLNIDNVKFDAKNGNVKLTNAHVMSIPVLSSKYAVPSKSNISNLEFLFSTNPNECYFKTVYDTSILSINASKSISSNGESFASERTCPQSGMNISNVYIDNKLTGYIWVKGITATFDKLDTGLYCAGNNSIQINSMDTSLKDNVTSIYAQYNQNFIRVKNLIASDKLTNSNVVGIDSNNNKNTFIYIDNCNQEEVFDMTLTNDASNAYTAWQLTCMNAGDTGKFITRNKNSVAQSWSVVRTGSDSSASLRMSCPQTANGWQLKVCNRDQGGFEVTPSVLGLQDLLIYFAYTGFESEAESTGRTKFYFDIDIPYRNNKNELYYKYTKYYNNAWYTDNSTWTDPNAVSKCMKLRMNITTLDPVIIRPYYNWYSPTGVVYMDPDMHFIPAV